jgi:ATP-binding cassette subfamily C (CFTR/MRP) protein 4
MCSMAASFILLALINRNIFFLVFARASTALHNNMFQQILRAPVRFFDVNPVGIILNRFSKDMGLVDNQMPTPMSVAINVS